MSYHIYQTEGIILDKNDINEADQRFVILTRDLGKINAVAQGVRYLKSKLRYNLDIFSYARLGLVASGDFWRIVDAEEINGWPGIRNDPQKLNAVSLIAGLINRMVRGQEPDFPLWSETKGAFLFLEERRNLGTADLKIFKLLTQLKILSHLGYIADGEKWLGFSFEECRGKEAQMVSTIENALKESQL